MNLRPLDERLFEVPVCYLIRNPDTLICFLSLPFIKSNDSIKRHNLKIYICLKVCFLYNQICVLVSFHFNKYNTIKTKNNELRT